MIRLPGSVLNHSYSPRPKTSSKPYCCLVEGQSREVSGPELRSVGGATGSLEEDCAYSYCAELEKAIVGRTTALTGAQWEGRQLETEGIWVMGFRQSEDSQVKGQGERR